MILNEPTSQSQSQSPIVVAPSDEASQSTSGLDSLVPGRVFRQNQAKCAQKWTTP